MDYSKRTQRITPRCLECGDKITYGRSDKKFCCDDCKNRHHNNMARTSRTVKRKVLAALEKNYEILDGIVMAGKDNARLSEVMALGFNPGFATSFRKINHHQGYECFDITYMMTDSKLCAISKIFH